MSESEPVRKKKFQIEKSRKRSPASSKHHHHRQVKARSARGCLNSLFKQNNLLSPSLYYRYDDDVLAWHMRDNNPHSAAVLTNLTKIIPCLP